MFRLCASRIAVIKRVRVSTFIAPVPPELRREFDGMQLKNSVFRLKVLAVISLVSFIASLLIVYFASGALSDELQGPGLIAGVSICFYVLLIIFRNAKNTLRWIICYGIVAGMLGLFAAAISQAGSFDVVYLMFFIGIFAFILVPDFKPIVFILFAVIYLVLDH
jgi:Na+/melibiose symporter-like transporter